MKKQKSHKTIDVRNIRFVPNIDTFSKTFKSKKDKAKSRRELNKLAVED